MDEYVQPGEIIEASKCGVYSRKIEWKGLKREPITNQLMTLYELDRNCSAEIVEAICLDPEELKIRQKLCVHLNVNDKIKGKAIRLYVKSKRNDLKIEIQEGTSSRHGASLANTRVRTVGIIKYSFDNYNKFLMINNKNLQINTK